MKIHNYGNDYVQSMKFQNQMKNATNGSAPKAGEAGGEKIGVEKEEEGANNQETKRVRPKKRQDKKEEASEGASEKQEEL